MTYQSNISGSISVASREMVAKIHRYVRWIFPLSSLDGGGSLYGVRGVKLIGSKKLIGGTSSVQESWAISLWCLIRSSIHSKISILNFYSTFNRLNIYIYTPHSSHFNNEACGFSLEFSIQALASIFENKYCRSLWQ